jgi:hypothetical protein
LVETGMGKHLAANIAAGIAVQIDAAMGQLVIADITVIIFVVVDAVVGHREKAKVAPLVTAWVDTGMGEYCTADITESIAILGEAVMGDRCSTEVTPFVVVNRGAGVLCGHFPAQLALTVAVDVMAAVNNRSNADITQTVSAEVDVLVRIADVASMVVVPINASVLGVGKCFVAEIAPVVRIFVHTVVAFAQVADSIPVPVDTLVPDRTVAEVTPDLSVAVEADMGKGVAADITLIAAHLVDAGMLQDPVANVTFEVRHTFPELSVLINAGVFPYLVADAAPIRVVGIIAGMPGERRGGHQTAHHAKAQQEAKESFFHINSSFHYCKIYLMYLL